VPADAAEPVFEPEPAFQPDRSSVILSDPERTRGGVEGPLHSPAPFPPPAMNLPQAEVIALDSMRAASPGFTPEDLDVPAFMRKRNEVM
jgi:hypothetical protein